MNDSLIAGTRNPHEITVTHPTTYVVITMSEHPRGAGLRLGAVTRKCDGWRFYPAFQSLPSRRGWPTPESALKGRVTDYELVPA